MKAVLTRVSKAKVTVDGEVVGSITAEDTGGILALVGVGADDVSDGEPNDKGIANNASWKKMAKKISELRILAGEKSALDLGAPILVVSQFTLYGETAKGRRPSWARAAPSELAKPVIDKIVAELHERGLDVATGSFGAMMEVSSVNQGPCTVLVET
ncbi:D-aminoacyl-tRNA deacylase [Corynebacterium propinquum]|uniref:D-aminoacyl-tRNA deacylase n=1 Tax=Corynebacterium propinquum TaxID=43769 RepID=UPI00254383A5|nr:D-aminoacyl-tRNA deacylase [Corynebacterium propinquum]MDK4302366.1 D-aminoacyl-tRNA deacylase [Corynebacterium propinquum]